MSRFTAPRRKVMRALGVDLPSLSRKSIEVRPNPPGQHGTKTSKRRLSDFGVKLKEKQKLRFNYGLTESQMRKLILHARKGNQPTGEQLLQLLERRLDNVVFRGGFAPTGIAARQLVTHGHVLLNGKPVNIPSIRVKIGDEITIKASAEKIPMVVESLAKPTLEIPNWLHWDTQSKTIKVAHLPESDQVPFPIDVQQVVEYYSNRI